MEISRTHQQEHPEWLVRFLQGPFFGACKIHKSEKNEVNKYCITCQEKVCRHCECSGVHESHNLLRIYRHLCKDVVRLDHIKAHMNCDAIQTYKRNKNMIVSIDPLPHCGSGALFYADASCCVCKRRLHEPELYLFCSISCKVQESGGLGKSESALPPENVQVSSSTIECPGNSL